MNEPPSPEPVPVQVPWNILTLLLSNQAKLMAMGNTLAFQLARMESGISGRDLVECCEGLEESFQEELVKCRRAVFEEHDALSAPPRRSEN